MPFTKKIAIKICKTYLISFHYPPNLSFPPSKISLNYGLQTLKVAWWLFCALEGLQDWQYTEFFVSSQARYSRHISKCKPLCFSLGTWARTQSYSVSVDSTSMLFLLFLFFSNLFWKLLGVPNPLAWWHRQLPLVHFCLIDSRYLLTIQALQESVNVIFQVHFWVALPLVLNRSLKTIRQTDYP